MELGLTHLHVLYCCSLNLLHQQSELCFELRQTVSFTNLPFFVVVTTDEENNWESIVNELLERHRQDLRVGHPYFFLTNDAPCK